MARWCWVYVALVSFQVAMPELNFVSISDDLYPEGELIGNIKTCEHKFKDECVNDGGFYKAENGEYVGMQSCPHVAPFCYAFEGNCMNACTCPPKLPDQTLVSQNSSSSCVLIFTGVGGDVDQEFYDLGDHSFSEQIKNNVTSLYIPGGKRVILFSDPFNYGEPNLKLESSDGPFINLEHYCMSTDMNVPSARNNGTSCEFEVEGHGETRVYRVWNDAPVSLRIEDANTEFQESSSVISRSLSTLLCWTILYASFMA